MHAQKRVYTVTNAEPSSSIESLHPPPPGISAKAKPTAATVVPLPKESQPATTHLHPVKFTLSVTYALERKEKEVLAPLPRSIVKKTGAGGGSKGGERMSMITPTTISSKRGGHLANASGVAQTSSDEKRTFYLQYSLGSHVVDAKSSNFSQTESIIYMNPLSPTQPLHPRLPPPAPTEWQATHEIEVTAESISQHLAARPVLIKVFELMRVEVEKKSGLTREMLELMATKSLKSASLADAGLEGTRMRKMRDSLKYGDAAGDSLVGEMEKERGRESTVVRSNNLDAGGGVEFVHFLSRQRASTNGPHEYPHPHHYDHPEKHMRRGSTNSIYALTSATSRNDTNPSGRGPTTIRRTRSSQSLAAIKSLRPKTPPSPHHHQHPLATLRNTALSASEAAASISGGRTTTTPILPPPDLSAMRFIRRPPAVHSASPTATTTNISPESRVNTPPWLVPTNGTHVSDGDVSSTVTGVSGNARRVKSDTSKSATSFSQELAAAAAAATDGYTTSGKTPFRSMGGFGSKSLTHLTKALLDPDTLSQISGNTVGGKTKKASQMGKDNKRGKEDEKSDKKKKKFVFEVRKVLVGRLFLDLTSLLCGETVTEAVLENPIPGFTQLSGKLSLNTPLLTPNLITHLKPISISLLCAQNIPNTPTPFHKLDETCLPLRIARFAFFNEAPTRWHESLLPGNHGSFALFGTRHVIFAGLLEGRELREWVGRKGGELVVRVYDRIPKQQQQQQQRNDLAVAAVTAGGGEDNEGEALFSCTNETQMGPYGEAKFDLSEFLRASEKGHRCSRVRAPILPGRRNDLKGGPAAGLWVESGATFVAEFEAWSQIVENVEDTGCTVEDDASFGRLIVFCSASDSEVRESIEQAIDEANSLSLSQVEPSETSDAIEAIEASQQNDSSEPSSTDSQLCQEEEGSVAKMPRTQDNDYISGFCLDMQSSHVFILEGLWAGAIGHLKDKLKGIQKSGGSRSGQTCFQFDPNSRFQERIWDCVEGWSDEGGRIVRGKLDKNLEDIVSTPRIYLKGAVPERAFRSLLWLSKLQSQHFLVENTTARPTNFPSRRSIYSLVNTFGCVVASNKSNNNNNNNNSNLSSVSLIDTQLSTPNQKLGSLPKLPKVFKVSKSRALRQPRPTSPVRTMPRARAPYNANGCVFNYSMQAQGSCIAQMDRIKMDMKKGYNYLYSDRYSLDLARVESSQSTLWVQK
ncbi:hypothetical protein BJ741DRAFT_710254 [Chytriomyces cf. hyalinus JEL632]|nr:hypothetical protein BJ741DRAFT_710254 [Chytriomyces cf. hyalinus JEL632]